MNVFGLLLGFSALFVIGLGFIWVIRGEYFFGYLWWPYTLALGILLVCFSLFIPFFWGSALMGLVGASLVWGSTELKVQAIRAELGWFPFRKEKIKPPFEKMIARWKAPTL
ncbi:MAG: DUF4491 family protein [Anaerolineales bacterium]|nr:DUF4491 family protein [Anaerolineales bacterium]